MFPRPDFNYSKSISADFVRVSTLLKNPNIVKFNDPKIIEKLQQIQDEIELKEVMQPCLRRSDTANQIVNVPTNNYFSS
jgi:hypothetical protein